MNNIPKVIHYCWFGKNKKSKLIKKCIKSWKKYCPDYKIIEWNEENYDIQKNKYMYEAYKEKKWAFVSDVARLDIIYTNGGIYLDTDVELIKPLDELLVNDIFFCLEGDKIATGLGFGSKKNNIIIKQLLNVYKNANFIKQDGSFDLTTCVIRNNTILKKYLNQVEDYNIINRIKNITIYPSEFFCPLDYITGQLKITNNTHAIHWYGASWMSKSKRISKKIKRIIKRIFFKK